MSLDLVVALAQIAGSLAVVATVVFLAMQVRENTRANTVLTRQFVDDGWLEVTRLVAQDDEIARIYREGMKDFGSLTTSDQWRFGALMQLAFNSYQNRFLMGAGTKYDDELQRHRLLWLAEQPGPRHWWPRAKQLYEPSFQTHVDKVLERADRAKVATATATELPQ